MVSPVLLIVINKWYKSWEHSVMVYSVPQLPSFPISFIFMLPSFLTVAPKLTLQSYHLSTSVVTVDNANVYHFWTWCPHIFLPFLNLSAHIIQASICDCVYLTWKWLIAPWTVKPSLFKPLTFHCLHFISKQSTPTPYNGIFALHPTPLKMAMTSK